jgi:hypothetical protein
VNGPQSDSRPTEGTKGILDRIKDVFVEFFKKIFSEKPFKVNYEATGEVVKIFKNPIHVQVNDLSGQGVIDRGVITISISERLKGEIRVVNAPEGNDSILWAAEMDRDAGKPLPTEGEDEENSIRNRVKERMGAIKAGLQEEIDTLRARGESHPPAAGAENSEAIAEEIRSLQARMDGTAPLLPEDMRFVAQAAGRDIAIISKEGGKTVFHLCREDGEYMRSDRLGDDSSQSARDFRDEFCRALKNGQRIFVQDGRAGCLQGEIDERGKRDYDNYDEPRELEFMPSEINTTLSTYTTDETTVEGNDETTVEGNGPLPFRPLPPHLM